MSPPSVPLEAIRQPAVLYGTDGRIVAANDLAEAHAGQPLESLSAVELATVYDVRVPGGAPFADAGATLGRALAGENVVEIPLVITLADGVIREILASASPVQEEGAVTGALVVWQDVTARVTTERALRESEEKYRVILSSSPDMVLLLEADGTVVVINETYARVLGRPVEELVGTNIWGVMPAEVTGYRRERFDIVLRSGQRWRFQEVRNGRSYDAIVQPVLSPGGEVTRIAIIARDVTELGRAEEALRQSEERLRLAQEGGSIGIWDRDAATDRVTVSLGVLQRFGLKEEEMTTLADWLGHVHTDDRAHVEAGRLAALAAGDPVDLEFRFITPTGEVRWVTLRARGLPDASGALSRVLGVIADVTDRKRTEEALVESEADARSFFQNMVDPCAICEMVVDERGEPVDILLVDVNPAFSRTLSLPARKIVGQTAFMILPALHREWLDLFLEVSREKGFVTLEEPFPALERSFHVTGFPVRHGRVAVVFRDIPGQERA